MSVSERYQQSLRIAKTVEIEAMTATNKDRYNIGLARDILFQMAVCRVGTSREMGYEMPDGLSHKFYQDVAVGLRRLSELGVVRQLSNKLVRATDYKENATIILLSPLILKPVRIADACFDQSAEVNLSQYSRDITRREPFPDVFASAIEGGKMSGTYTFLQRLQLPSSPLYRFKRSYFEARGLQQNGTFSLNQMSHGYISADEPTVLEGVSVKYVYQESNGSEYPVSMYLKVNPIV
jgi:hypothetical protein